MPVCTQLTVKDAEARDQSLVDKKKKELVGNYTMAAAMACGKSQAG